MPSVTEFASLKVYDTINDANVKFIDFISDTCGESPNSNMQKIDALLRQQVNTKLLGVPNGVATLGANGLIPNSQLPSYVSTVQEYETLSKFPPTGESGVIYVALDTGYTYRWGGSRYTPMTSSVADNIDGGKY